MWPFPGGAGQAPVAANVPAAFRKKAEADAAAAGGMPGAGLAGGSMPSSMAPAGGMPDMMAMQAMMMQQMSAGMPPAMGMPGGAASMMDPSGVMQMMMAQQMQFQQQMMQDQLQELQEQQDKEQAPVEKVSAPWNQRTNKPLLWPPSLEVRPEPGKEALKDQLIAFMEKFPFEDRHKVRLLEQMSTRTDTFEEDLETLYMIMGAARSPSALLVDSLKRMEDGIFQARDLETRMQFRRAQEIQAEAKQANQKLRGQGSVRKAFEEQQKAARKEMAINAEREIGERDARKGKGKGNRSRSRRRNSRSRSRSNSRRQRSRSRGDRGRNSRR